MTGPAGPSAGPQRQGRTARRAVLVAVVLVVVLVVAAGVWRLVRPGDPGLRDRDADGITAWQSRTEANQILRDTAAVTGLNIHLWTAGIGEVSCQRSDGTDGTSYSLDTLDYDGRADGRTVIAAAVAYWQQLGLKVDPVVSEGPTSSTAVLKAWTTTSTGASIEVQVGPGATLFDGVSGCAHTGGGPTPLPTPTLLPVSSGVPVPARTP